MSGSHEDKRNKKTDAQPAQGDHQCLLELVGKFEWDQSFDYKAERGRERMVLSETETQLSEEQLANLRERVENPGPIASPERVAAALAKFRG